LEALVTGQFEVVKGGGKVMINASATNKAFSFTIPQGLSTKDIMEVSDEALAWIDSHSETELTSFLARRASSWAQVRYRPFPRAA
jgi:predicted metal-dependent hydrolase